jgi:hypothetical protein
MTADEHCSDMDRTCFLTVRHRSHRVHGNIAVPVLYTVSTAQRDVMFVCTHCITNGQWTVLSIE